MNITPTAIAVTVLATVLSMAIVEHDWYWTDDPIYDIIRLVDLPVTVLLGCIVFWAIIWLITPSRWWKF